MEDYGNPMNTGLQKRLIGNENLGHLLDKEPLQTGALANRERWNSW